MRGVLRGVLSVVAGFVVASVVMMIVESVNGRILHPELGRMAQGVTDREVLRGMLAAAPVSALLVVLVGWVLGGVAGGCTTTWIAGRTGTRQAVILGLLLTLAGIANNLMLPPPIWFWIVGLLVFVPSALAGAQVALAKRA